MESWSVIGCVINAFWDVRRPGLSLYYSCAGLSSKHVFLIFGLWILCLVLIPASEVWLTNRLVLLPQLDLLWNMPNI